MLGSRKFEDRLNWEGAKKFLLGGLDFEFPGYI